MQRWIDSSYRAAKTAAAEAKAEAKTGEAVTEAKTKAEAADAKAKEVEAALVNYVTKAVADETYQPKGEYATKAEVQAIGLWIRLLFNL